MGYAAKVVPTCTTCTNTSLRGYELEGLAFMVCLVQTGVRTGWSGKCYETQQIVVNALEYSQPVEFTQWAFHNRLALSLHSGASLH